MCAEISGYVLSGVGVVAVTAEPTRRFVTPDFQQTQLPPPPDRPTASPPRPRDELSEPRGCACDVRPGPRGSVATLQRSPASHARCSGPRIPSTSPLPHALLPSVHASRGAG